MHVCGFEFEKRVRVHVAIILLDVLFVCSINVEQGESVDKILATGKHSVRDIFCKVCQ